VEEIRDGKGVGSMKPQCLLAYLLMGIVVGDGFLLPVRGNAGATHSAEERGGAPAEVFVIAGGKGGGEAGYVTFEGLAAMYRAATEVLSGFEEYDAILSKLRRERQLVYFPAGTKVEVLERRHEGSRVRVLDGEKVGESFWFLERSLRRPEDAGGEA
jgi:hypothetical protein